ncbi:MAG TPA: Lsr2 family protein [Microbacterium sp.]|nr:Lsr2 family protein [Microbacterium sp.]
MARKIIHQLVDDLDGTVLEPGEGVSVHFSLDGKAYEIDLTEENAGKLREALAPYISAGRRSVSGVTRPRAKSQSSSSRDLGKVREWARDNGYSVSDRGRVPGEVLEAYDAAH